MSSSKSQSDVLQKEFEKLEFCSNCRFAKGIDNESLYCRRYPPSIVNIDDQGDFVCEYPIVDFKDWCGEHKWRAQ